MSMYNFITLFFGDNSNTNSFAHKTQTIFLVILFTILAIILNFIFPNTLGSYIKFLVIFGLLGWFTSNILTLLRQNSQIISDIHKHDEAIYYINKFIDDVNNDIDEEQDQQPIQYPCNLAPHKHVAVTVNKVPVDGKTVYTTEHLSKMTTCNDLGVCAINEFSNSNFDSDSDSDFDSDSDSDTNSDSDSDTEDLITVSTTSVDDDENNVETMNLEYDDEIIDEEENDNDQIDLCLENSKEMDIDDVIELCEDNKENDNQFTNEERDIIMGYQYTGGVQMDENFTNSMLSNILFSKMMESLTELSPQNVIQIGLMDGNMDLSNILFQHSSMNYENTQNTDENKQNVKEEINQEDIEIDYTKDVKEDNEVCNFTTDGDLMGTFEDEFDFDNAVENTETTDVLNEKKDQKIENNDELGISIDDVQKSNDPLVEKKSTDVNQSKEEKKYKNLSVTELKELASKQGLIDLTTKYKKGELISILVKHDAH